MAEVITEMILPGTYIEVRAEGLLSIGGISTGNVGVLGTAERGNGHVVTLSSFEEARAQFGSMGEWDANDPKAMEGNLTLVRALKLLFDNGARTVFAQRVFDDQTAVAATHQVLDNNSAPLQTLRAKTSGTWGNHLQIRVEDAEEAEQVSGELVSSVNGTLTLSAQAVVEPATEGASLGNITVYDQGPPKKYQLKLANPSSEVVQVNPSTRALSFMTAPSAGATVRANYFVPRDNLRKVTLRYDNIQEVYVVPSVAYLMQRLQDERNPSQLVDVVGNSNTSLNVLPETDPSFVSFTGGVNGAVTAQNYKDVLDNVTDQNVQLVVVAGLDFDDLKSSILGHVEKTENLGRERIAVIGADANEVDKISENANEVADKRVVLVAPGLQQVDGNTGRALSLPPYFAAAAVAGKLSSLAPHISLTNKTLAGIDGLASSYNTGQLKTLVQDRVLTLQTKRGVRVVKGISTDDGAFRQISIRRIVDYIKEGTRIGANQYIGKLNNRRVRGNLFTTLDSFLADLVTREFLTEYNLKVFADRAMEIRGEVQVIMDLKPTFSIDFVRVTMNLN